MGDPSLIEVIYDTAMDASAPRLPLAQFAEYLRYQVGGITVAAREPGGVRICCEETFGIDLATCQRAEEQCGISGRTSLLDGHETAVGEFNDRKAVASEEEFQRHAYFQEFVVPNRLEDGLRVMLHNSTRELVFLHLARPAPHADPVHQFRTLKTLVSHLVRGARLRASLAELQSLRTLCRESADLSPYALVVLDNAGEVFLANRKAEALHLRDGLTLARGGLRAALDKEQQRLHREIQCLVTARAPGAPGAAGIDLRITRPANRRPYQLMLVPLAQRFACEGRRPAAAVIVFDPEETSSAPVQRCRELFGLTRAEAEVALAVMQGRSIEEDAAARGRSVTTARNLMKRVFQKTGVSRQTELARLMLNSPLILGTLPDSAPRA